MRARGRRCTWPSVAVLLALMAVGVPLRGLLAAGTHSDGRTGAGRASTLVTGPPFWLPVASMHVAREYLAAAVGRDGQIYALGGNDANDLLSSVEAYTPAVHSWRRVASLLPARQGVAAATGPDGRVYAISGNSPELNTRVEAYVPLQNRWVPAAATSEAHEFGAAVQGPDGRVYAIGGTDGDGIAAVEAYNTQRRRWTHVTDLPTPRGDLGVATGLDGRIYALGGTKETLYGLPTMEAYDVARQRWARLADLPTTRMYVAAAAGADGRIYAIGGYGADNGTSITNVDAYDPRTNRWVAVAPLGTPRSRLAAVRGADGRIYTIGGFQGAEPEARGTPPDPADLLATVEAYGPILHLAPQSALVGSTMVLKGTNFAAHATVRVTWGSTPGGTLLGIGHTDRAGNLPHPLRFRLPRGVRPGYHMIVAMDNRSRYPVTAPLTVTR